MITVKVPYTFKSHNMYSFISQVIDNKMEPMDDLIKFDFRHVNFTEPSGVTVLCNLIEWLIKKGVKVKFIVPDDTSSKPTDAISYLDDSEFFCHYLGRNITECYRRRTSTLPLKLITYDQSYSWIENTFITWLSGCLNSDRRILSEIFTTSYGEIFNNIRDHAGENSGCIFAQHYPKKNKIIISISDFGVGIPFTIRRRYGEQSDSHALEKAIKEGVSSKSTPKNRGAGLKTLLQNVVVNYGGQVQIRSYSGVLYVFKTKDNEVRVNSKQVPNKYPGTFIEITFNTRTISDLKYEEEDFSWDF